jgi:hypothetical protein
VWEAAADSHLLKLQRLKIKVLRTTGNLTSQIPSHDLHTSFKIPYLYDFVTNPCRKQVTVILNYANVIIRNIGQGKVRHKKYKRLTLVGGQAYDRAIV